MGTAYVTFNKAVYRAEYLVRLSEGLTNRRKRKTRSDWSRAFKTLMHWPQCHTIERVDSADAVLVIRHGSRLSSDDFTPDAAGDLLRAALVMSVSAMDAYFHAKILRYVVSHSKAHEPSSRLLNERILVKDFVSGRKKKRANTALRSAVERNLSYQSLQQPDKIADALGLIGVSDFWTGVADTLDRDKKDLCDSIEKIVGRRNKIAHEGDLSQSKKARNKSRGISVSFVKESIALLKSVIDASEALINAAVN